MIFEGRLEVKLLTIWTDGKAAVGRVREEKRREEERRSEKRKSQKKEDAGAGKGRKVAIHCVYPMICGRKVGSLKRRVRSHLGRWEMNNCTPLWREARLQVKKHKKHFTFGALSEVAMSKKCTPLWCEAPFEVKSVKTDRFGTLLEVEMFKKCTPMWGEAHVQVKMYKAHHAQNTFGSWDAQKVYTVVARSTFRSQNVQSTSALERFWKLRCWKSARRCGTKHILKSVLKTLHVRATFGRWSVVLCGRRKGFCTVPKVSKKWGSCGISKTMAGVGHLKKICEDRFRVAGAVQEPCSSEMLRAVAFWSIRFTVLGKWFCLTDAALRMTRLHFFLAGAVL